MTGTIANINGLVQLIASDPDSSEDVQEAAQLLETVNSFLSDKTASAEPYTELTGGAGLRLENYGKDWVRYYSVIGGDLSVNTGLDEDSSTTLITSTENTHITRTGNISNHIVSGTVIGGAGASAAAALGNLEIKGSYSTIQANLTMNGETSVTVDGSVDTTADSNANLIGWTNGGLAVGLGGKATSIVTGNSSITINGAGRTTYESPDDFEDPANDAIPPLTTAINVMKGSKVNAIGVAGGGTSISTMGGTATSTVDGSTTVTIDNATVIGAAGGGVAASVDLTTIANLVYSSNGQDVPTGNNDGHLDVTLEQVASLLKMDINSLPEDLEAKVTATNAITGGEATSSTGATNINLKGSSTAVGVMGGGIATAIHTYTWKDNDTTKPDVQVTAGSSYGSSAAKADTGRSNITINLNGDGDPAALSQAIRNMYLGFKDNSTQADALSGLKDKGMAVAVFGGGTAIAYGNAEATMEDSRYGAHADVTTAGSDILLNSGYAAGVFGGGAALAINTAYATSKMDADVTITTASGMKTVALVGGGLAWAGEEDQGVNLEAPTAESSANTVNIMNEGDTDGIFGGGVALSTGAKGAKSSVTTSNITVNGGTVSTVNMDVLMGALKNDHEPSDPYPQWSFLGVNASSYMADIKGILDETAIVGGGLGLGLTGYADVTDTSNITINDGTVNGSILGGGIAIDNMTDDAGAYVAKSTIALNGGTVNGSVYAGGAINKATSQLVADRYSDSGLGYDTTNTASRVDTATITLNGTKVAGEISGQGFEVVTTYVDGNFNPYAENNGLTYAKSPYESVGTSELVITGSNTLSYLDASGNYTGTSKIHHFNEINVEAGSTTYLVADAPSADNSAFIDGGLLAVDDAAYLDASGLADSTSPYYVAINTEEGSTFWSEGNILYDRLTSLLTVNAAEGDFSIQKTAIETPDQQKVAASRFARDLGAGPLQELLESGYANDWDVRPGAKQFFEDWGMSRPSTRDDFGRAALLGEDTAVTANTVAIARTVTDNLTSRLSYIGDFATAPEAYGERGAVWAEYIRNDFKADGLSSSFGDVDADGDFNGVMAGTDFAVIGGTRLGAAVYYVNGDADGSISENDYDGYGFALYGNYRNDDYDFNIIGDIGYGRVSHDIEGRLNGRKLDADRDLNVFTVGVKAEKRFQVAENCYVVPYTGIRYFNIDAKDYDTKYGGQKLFDNEVESQSIWTLPLGVSTTHAFKLQSGWTVYPKFDVAYIWAFGDKDNDVKVDMGTGAHSALNYKVVDDGSWRGAIGVDASYGTWGFALGYAYQQGSDIRDQKFFVNMSYAF